MFSRFARYGLIWACCGPALLATLVIFQPPVPAGLAKAILLSYLDIGFGLLAAFPIRYMVRRFRKKGARREPLQVGLWAQELDSCGPDPSAKLG